MIVPFPSIDAASANLGRGMRSVREARGVSLDRLASETHLDARRIALAEQGRSPLNSVELHAVINALHIPLGLLFDPTADLTRLRRL